MERTPKLKPPARRVDRSVWPAAHCGTNFKLSDVQTIPSQCGLRKNGHRSILVPGSRDPGATAELGEALLDIERSGASADATILFVHVSNVLASVEHAIDQNLAHFIIMSYGRSERTASSLAGSVCAFRTMAQQVNGQGIIWAARRSRQTRPDYA